MSGINSFILFNLLLLVGTAISYGVFLFSPRLSFKAVLRFNYGLLIATGMCWLVAINMTAPKVGSLPAVNLSLKTSLAKTAIEKLPQPILVSKDTVSWMTNIFLISLVILVLGILILMGREILRLGRTLYSSHQYKRLGRVRVRLSEHNASPFSAWFPFRHYIVLPYEMAASPRKMRLCVAHEIQHHRQHDTKWVYALLAARILCFMNPAIYLWNRIINEVQEFSCDEVLLGRKNFSRDEYISCLIEVAENSLKRKQGFVCATSLSFVKGQNLKRRIQVMLNAKTSSKAKRWLPGMAAVSLILLTVTAFAGKTTFSERLTNVKFDHQILAADEAEIIAGMNAILSNPLRKKAMKDALERFKVLKPELQAICLDDCDEFYAVGLVESGYQDFPPQNGDPERSTGMWQIIASTGRNLGLTITPDVDERRDIIKSARAAHKYLQMNRERFSSWDLSILAYNAGERAVEEATVVSASENPWLVRKILPTETQRYYIKWIVARFFMKNPKMLDVSRVAMRDGRIDKKSSTHSN